MSPNSHCVEYPSRLWEGSRLSHCSRVVTFCLASYTPWEQVRFQILVSELVMETLKAPTLLGLRRPDEIHCDPTLLRPKAGKQLEEPKPFVNTSPHWSYRWRLALSCFRRPTICSSPDRRLGLMSRSPTDRH